ncbi:MAG TPA: hypothetical protein VGD69_05525 [Herpetosiphonaceae bacterium]
MQSWGPSGESLIDFSTHPAVDRLDRRPPRQARTPVTRCNGHDRLRDADVPLLPDARWRAPSPVGSLPGSGPR